MFLLSAGEAISWYVKFTSEDWNEEEKIQAENFIALMTPIIKSYASDKSVENTNRAMQIYGGHGFITDHCMEQLVRDARITTIY